MMDISISINNKELHYIELYNRGPMEDASGQHRYTWRLYSYPGGEVARREGEIDHVRSDGALVLAAKVLAIAAQNPEPGEVT